MIKINLALRKSANVAGGTQTRGAGPSFNMGSLNFSELKDIPNLKGLLLLLVTGIGVYYGLEQYKENEINLLNAELDKKQKVVADVKKKLEESRSLERLKRELEADQKTLENKFNVITKLREGREMAARLLIQLSESVPKDVWLLNTKLEPTGNMQLTGEAVSFDSVTSFSTALQTTVFFKSAIPQGNVKGKDAKTGADIVTFSMPLERR